MTLTILVVNYKTCGLLRQFLRGLYKYAPTVSFEVIVVDNGSEDSSLNLLREEFSKIQLIELTRNLGYSVATNIGIRQSRGEYVLLVNTDIVIRKKDIDQLYNYLKQRFDVGAVGPKLINPDGTLQNSAFRFYRPLTPIYRRTRLGKTSVGRRELRRFVMSDWGHNTNRSVDWLMSSCLMLRRKALFDVGLLDERFFVYFSDTDLCRRLWLTGWQVHYTSEVEFIHYHRRESLGDIKIALIHIIDWLRYLMKWRNKKLPQT